MKKITLNETDLLKIVKRVLNEQKKRYLQIYRQFDEDEIDILHHIFERELKPPFSKGEKNDDGNYPYHNRDGEEIGWLYIQDKHFSIHYYPFKINIIDKVSQVFGFPLNTTDWWVATQHHLKSWLENQINAEINMV